MIKRKGDLFTTSSMAIGHGVNCQGKMGSGIAVEFRNRFPNNYDAYYRACEFRFLSPGQTFLFKEGDLFIFNMATQDLPGANATYDYVLRACADAAHLAVDIGLDRIAIPMVGCGIGGLEWLVVEKLLSVIESVHPDFEFEVWKL